MNFVTIDEESSTMTAILVGIFLVVLTIAGLLFYKHCNRRKDEYADMPELVDAENTKFRCRLVFTGNATKKSDYDESRNCRDWVCSRT